jgi:type IV pilus secretin PilQ/predicted competence protein
MKLTALAALVLTSVIATTLTADVNTVAPRTSEPRAELRAISTRLDGTHSTVLIEASEPVAYVTSQPDPLTVLVDLRNVRSGQLPPGILGPLPPVTNVNVEEAVAGDGAPVARVRVSLAHRAPHHVRSSRNVIFVEVERPVIPSAKATVVGDTGSPGVPGSGSGLTREPNVEHAIAPASRSARTIRAIRPLSVADSVGVALIADGELIATSVEETKDKPARLVLDFRGVSARSLPATTEINRGDVKRVRVATSTSPLVTRVVIDLANKTNYRLVPSGADGEELQILFAAREPAAAQTAAPLAPSASASARPEAGELRRDLAGAASGREGGPDSQQPAAPPAPPIVDVTQPAQPAVPRFTGDPVTLDFEDADLRSVLRSFADISGGLNIVLDPSIQGRVNVSLRDVPWDQALDIILKANKLGYSVDGTVVRIAPLSVLAQEEEERRKLTDARALAGDLSVLTVPLSYAKASELVPILTRSALSSRGEVQVDTRTNTLIVRDLPDRLTTAGELVKALDRPQPQVEIEARIVQTTRDFARAIGVEWGFNGRVDPALGNTTNLAFPNNGSIRGQTGGAQGTPGGTITDTGVNLRAPAANSAIGIALGSVNGALNLDVILSQLESSGRGRLLSTPRVSTQNNVEAEMTQGVQIPIQTVANNTITVSFKDAALTLRVTPQITASNTVIMRVFLENATPDFSRAVNGIPPIDTQRAVTTVLVADGETTVIGGIYVSIEQTSNDRVPLMHRIPLLGWLFKRDTMSDESRELLIFITPRITKG